ncbi:MAG: hypothetical protein IPM24_04005 [Bryobacterales bacterium]|nr:hypothetical protein [Bryobacterales bacterium]
MLLCFLLLSGCSFKKKPVAAAPAPPATVTAARGQDATWSEPQTDVVLPREQPLSAEAVVIRLPDPPPPEPPKRAPAPKPRASAPPAPEPEPPPIVPADQPAAPAPRVRIRAVETAAERQRLEREVTQRRQEANQILARARTRSLNLAQRNTVQRAEAFLAQADSALDAGDLRQADALSSRALLLCRELARE